VSQTIFDDDGWDDYGGGLDSCEVCGQELEGGWCPSCDPRREVVVSYGVHNGDWRGGWRFAGAMALPITLIVFSNSVAMAVVVAVLTLVVGVGCKLGLHYRAGAASNSPQEEQGE